MTTRLRHTKGRNIAFQDRFRITLTCGCNIVAVNSPLNEKATYACTFGLGHGYTLPWLSSTAPTGFIRINSREQ